MQPLLAVEIPMPSPTDVASGISKLGLYYIIGILVSAVVALSWRLLVVESNRRTELKEVQDQRIADRDKSQDQVTTLAKEMHATVAEDGKGFWALQRELQRVQAELARLAPKDVRPRKDAPAVEPQP